MKKILEERREQVRAGPGVEFEYGFPVGYRDEKGQWQGRPRSPLDVAREEVQVNSLDVQIAALNTTMQGVDRRLEAANQQREQGNREAREAADKQARIDEANGRRLAAASAGGGAQNVNSE